MAASAAGARRGGGPSARIRQLLSRPLVQAYLMAPAALAVLAVLLPFHLVENRPVWVYAALLFTTWVPATAANVVYARRPGSLAAHVRAATDGVAATLVIYATGWGPALGMVYLVAALQLVGAAGPRMWRAARLWTVAGVAAGQAGIALGWVPSYFRERSANGVALLGVVMFLLVSRIAESIDADRHRAWDRLAALATNSSDMVLVLDTAARPVFASGACARITGLSPEELLAADLPAVVHPDDLGAVRAFLAATLEEAAELTDPMEVRIRHRDGEWRHVEATVTNLADDPAVGGLLLNVRDVTDRKRAESELAVTASHDSLTGLANRALFLDRLAASLRAVTDGETWPAVLFVDIDRFKLINDSLGHAAGDRVLVEAARRLRGAVRPTDTVARLGGDEFVVLCEPPCDAQAVGRRLLGVFDRPFRLGGDDHYLSASVGLATPPGPETEPSDLIRDADTAMYRAKELGRGRLQVFDEAARSAAVSRAHTEHLLRHAADRGELRLHYQPIVDLRTGRVLGAEALLRWDHPRLGLVGPDRFIATAEDSGLIVPIGEWVLTQACLQAARWAEDGQRVDMAVNVSGRQLADDSFVWAVRRAVGRLAAQSAPVDLVLEITETALITDTESAIRRLGELKSLGVKLAMDDFGTGYSSLANLRKLPVDILKIDRQFVAGLADSEDDGTIVRSMIALAHSLGRSVVAEGVEDAEQLKILQQLDCDLAQGYHLGRPASAPARLEELRTGMARSLGPAAADLPPLRSGDLWRPTG